MGSAQSDKAEMCITAKDSGYIKAERGGHSEAVQIGYKGENDKDIGVGNNGRKAKHSMLEDDA
eukprot:14211793-Alexandrium_andersonii.AAC.1